MKKVPTRRNPVAKALAQAALRARVVRDKKKYSRKGKRGGTWSNPTAALSAFLEPLFVGTFLAVIDILDCISSPLAFSNQELGTALSI